MRFRKHIEIWYRWFDRDGMPENPCWATQSKHQARANHFGHDPKGQVVREERISYVPIKPKKKKRK